MNDIVPGIQVWWKEHVDDPSIPLHERTAGTVLSPGVMAFAGYAQNESGRDVPVISTEAPDEGMVVVQWMGGDRTWEYEEELVKVT